MAKFARYIYAWNDWIVVPGLLIAAIIAHAKYRKPSTLFIISGLGLVLVAQLMRVFYPGLLHPVHAASIVIYGVGAVASVSGFVWFAWKHSETRKNEI